MLYFVYRFPIHVPCSFAEQGFFISKNKNLYSNPNIKKLIEYSPAEISINVLQCLNGQVILLLVCYKDLEEI